MEKISYKDKIKALRDKIENSNAISIYGTIHSIKGSRIEAIGIKDFVSIGDICEILDEQNMLTVPLEVIGFEDHFVILMSFRAVDGISLKSKIRVKNSQENFLYPDLSWRGRVIDAFANPIDKRGFLTKGTKAFSIKNFAPSSLSRQKIGKKIELGVKSLDMFVNCCLGQKMGIFANSGVGKSVLISMISKYAKTDIKVIALIGERSKEVREFIEEYLGEEGLNNSVIIVATSDESALTKRRALYTAVAVAEYFQERKNEVLCVVDSMTRFAMAQREIGLNLGENPTTKGYTVSTFSEISKIIERMGTGAHSSITSLISVLLEEEDNVDPVGESVKSFLDGHIFLDRKIAERNRFPAVNVLKSISRTMPKCNSEYEISLINKAKDIISKYENMQDLIQLGAYKKGTNPELDRAIVYYNKIEQFLKQAPTEFVSADNAFSQLEQLLK